MDNYIFITAEGDPLGIADRLADEGKEVVVGLIEQPPAKQDPPVLEKRNELYKGIIKIKPAEEVMEWMEKLVEKDRWFVMFDYGDLWPWSERVLEMGFRVGIFPTEAGYKLEDDRKAGKSFAKKHYKELIVADAEEFKSCDDAREFLKENEDKIYVLKSEGSNAETVVPLTDEPELAHRQLLGALDAEGEAYEKGGFTLEEKIRNAIEISPVMVFWNGEPLFSLVELENKGFGCGNIGRLTGGCQNLSIQTDLDCGLNGLAFPPIIYEMASKQPGIGIYDAGILYNPQDSEFYFTEFCSQRWGWDGIFSEIAMSGGPSNHFDAIASGESPIRHKYGAAVRLFQVHPDGDIPGVYQDGYTMDWMDEASNDLCFYCIRKEKGRFVSVGYRRDLGVATGASNYLDAAVDRAYRAVDGFVMTGVYYRPKFDFLSRDYQNSIMNRYQWLVNSGLI